MHATPLAAPPIPLRIRRARGGRALACTSLVALALIAAALLIVVLS